MKKTLHLLVFVLALATAMALAQTSYGGTSPQTQNPTANPNPNPSVPTDQGTATSPASQDTHKHDQSKASVDDSTLNTQIKEQLSGDPAMKNVQATVSNGVVNLDGTVANKADKKRAKQMVAAIPGVRKVHDRLTVNANATAGPGSNEPASASVGTTGTTASSATTGNTAGSMAGNAGASSTTPQIPSASATTSTTGGSSTGANGMPQSDVSAGANAGASGTGVQAQTGAGVSATTPSSTPQSSTAGTAGTSSTPSSTMPQSSAEGTAGATAAGTAPAPGAPGDIGSDLQTQIQTALKHEPTLANDNINAVVAGDTIDLSGNVASGKERQTALRIAQSFAGNRRVVDHLTVAGQGPGTSMGGRTPNQSGTGMSNPSSTPTNPNASPESTPNPR